MNIDKIVSDLVHKYKTIDPFVIAENEGITYIYNDDFSDEFVASNYNDEKIRAIILNGNLRYDPKKYFYMAHELGHALLHHETVYFYHNGYNEKTKNESEANEFATKLLLSDFIIEENMSSYEVLKLNYIPESMAKFIEEDF